MCVCVIFRSSSLFLSLQSFEMSKFFAVAQRFSRHIQVQRHLAQRLVPSSPAVAITTTSWIVPRRAFSTEPSSSVVNFEDIQTIIKNKNKVS